MKNIFDAARLWEKRKIQRIKVTCGDYIWEGDALAIRYRRRKSIRLTKTQLDELILVVGKHPFAQITVEIDGEFIPFGKWSIGPIPKGQNRGG